VKIKAQFRISDLNMPIIAVAQHDGHELRKEACDLISLDEDARLREEDPYTGAWARAFPNHVVVKTSRFEVDLNRSRDTAVYIDPQDAWGLNVWKSRPETSFIERSLAEYDSFYDRLHGIFSDFQQRFKRFLVFDIHSYNHRRGGPDAEPADPQTNPEVNVGTGTMDRKYWSRIVDRFIFDLSHVNYDGRNLDVRENIKFYGRQLPQWTHENFPASGCVLALEFKKFFMDEWTGRPDHRQLKMINWALQSTIGGITAELERFNGENI